jgi:hypothetical protein
MNFTHQPQKFQTHFFGDTPQVSMYLCADEPGLVLLVFETRAIYGARQHTD